MWPNLFGPGWEWGMLHARDRLLEGRDQVVAIIGEAGLGKVYLVAELRGRLGTGIRFLEGRCHEFTQANAYGVVVQHLLEHLDFEEQDPRDVGRVQLRTGLFHPASNDASGSEATKPANAEDDR